MTAGYEIDFVMSWKQAPPTQFGLAHFLVFTGAIAAFFAVGVQVGFFASFIAIGMPLIGKTLVELGIRIKNDKQSERVIKSGSLFLGCWFPIGIPVWMYIVVVFVLRLKFVN